RIIRTARAMGIRSVAVYSEADADALHVREADEAVAIGPAPAAKSYLDIARIVAAAKESGAEAIHPGFGFLSESPAFARAVTEAGLVFIGPPAEAIAAMGDKIESKRIARAAGLPVVPGALDVVPDAEAAVQAARQLGYPVMIKAAGGGGGKGIRTARNDAEVRAGFAAARNEAVTGFGDDRIFVEKLVAEPRHIEIQVLADAHGAVIHLGERECSIQRRHQKVIEEAPSPLVDSKMRAAMGRKAVALARAAGYRSAGTVEFIVDAARNFYFMEMNTRLQVEHPVTEAVTGLDLVELMIRIAAGEPLPLRQSEVRLKGWSIEARIYAEDPARGFLPSTGRLVRYREPLPGPSLRIDTGVYEGAEVCIHYDPMIAKVISRGADRAEAIAVLRDALDSLYIRGVGNNIGFLAAILSHPRFAAGRLSTGFIAEEFPDGFTGRGADRDTRALLIAVAAAVHHQHWVRENAISGRLKAARPPGSSEWVVLIDGERHEVAVAETAGGFAVLCSGRSIELVSDWRLGDPLYHTHVDGRAVTVQVERNGIGYRLAHGGAQLDVRVLSRRAGELSAIMPAKRPPDTARRLLSPMPGLLVSIAVQPGQRVKAGQELAVVEAMKMENMLRAERDARVSRLLARPGDSLSVDQAILEFEFD
ncbi:MAG: ATP-grasp domain-containing protein, partial [Rhodospirillaceae bacterium]|nr:ATP-grasp domain-containing protein [Rhodospirillaceae bacterium]